MDKKVLLLVLLVTIILNATTVLGARFSDTTGHWAEKVVDEMATKGILNGFEDGTFKPNDSVTREQFAKILVESLNIEEKDNNIIFQDVEDGRWSKDYIERASKYLTIGKTNDGRRYFMPTEEAVREEVATAVVKASGLENETPNYDLLKQFSDEDKISDDFRKYIAIAVEHGIMQGKGGFFDPQGYLTRAEVSQLLFNINEKVKNQREYNVKIKIDDKEIKENSIIDVESRLILDNSNCVNITFDKTIKNDNLNLVIKNSKDEVLNIGYGYVIPNESFVMDTNIFLEPREEYTILISGIVDTNGNSLEDYYFKFYTSGEKIEHTNEKLEVFIRALETSYFHDKLKISLNRRLEPTEWESLTIKTEYGVIPPKRFAENVKYSEEENSLTVNVSDILKYYETYEGVSIEQFNNEKLELFFYVVKYPEGETIVNQRVSTILKANVIYGDLNYDDKVTKADVKLIEEFLKNGSASINFTLADVDLDDNLTENDFWLINNVAKKEDVKLPHNCTNHEEKYERLDDNKHEKIEICECGEIRIVLKTEKHNFTTGKCVCGAVEGTEYIVLEEYTYVKRYGNSPSFVEIQIGSGDFVMYQDDDIIINPKPDEIREDKFGNQYAYYDFTSMEQGEELNVSIKRRVTCASYEEIISERTNTEIFEGSEIYLNPQERIDSDYEKTVLKTKELTEDMSSDYKKAEAIFEYVNVNMEYDLSEKYANKGSISAIENMRGTSEEFTTLFVAMCRAIDIPSRAIGGYVIQNENLVNSLWAEIYLKDFGWVPVYPTVIYTLGGERVPYLDGFCRIVENNYIATYVYNYEKADRTMKGVNESEYSVKLIENDKMYGL